jgi:prephenate dehydrogenase
MSDRFGIFGDKPMSILASINQATKYFELATTIFNSVKDTAAHSSEDLSADTLEEAKDNLAAAMERAHAAHDGLAEAIDEALAQREALPPSDDNG